MASRIARTLPLAAFVLHRYDWSESSLILDLFTREQGRIAVAAKGAKRPSRSCAGAAAVPAHRTSRSAGTLGERGAPRSATLRGAEWAGGQAMLDRRRAASAASTSTSC